MVQRAAEKMHKLDFDDEVTGLIYGLRFAPASRRRA